jgi:hypothetical protein
MKEKGNKGMLAGMPSEPIQNEQLQLATSFVMQTRCNLFLTGKAGTGKTTFLKGLHQQTDKNMVITAPTGVAAINACGVTLHSFFQLPLGPYVPGSELQADRNQSKYRLNKEKKTILKNLDLLVIDEISMVRADILDAVDSVLRYYRGNDLPFGGVQLLMIGDLHQLPPIAKKEEWDLLRNYYRSVYFFSSGALARSSFISIELNYIYRQTDQKFITILNQLRENRLDAQSLSELNKRYIKGYVPVSDQGYISLTTHNTSAESMNHSRLQGIEGKEYFLAAEIKGEFQKNSYPAPEELRLKEGAQVMFLRNDTSAEKSYFNGKIGKITKITAEEIKVICPGSSQTITVEPVVWENIRYSLNKKTMKLEEDVIGRFKQFPLKLAWSITIHKSQGLTFEKAIIDAEAAFVHGQTYVALSRCKTLDGVILSSPISPRGIPTDRAISDFDQYLKENPPSSEYLEQAKTSFQQNLLLDCFDFKQIKNHLSRLVRQLLDHQKTVRCSGLEQMQQIMERANLDFFDIGDKFKRQLQHLFQKGNLPESDLQILERLNKASIWFREKFKEIFTDSLENLLIETDNSILAIKLEDGLQQLKKEVSVKLAGIKSLENGFSPSEYQHKIRLALVRNTSKRKDFSLDSDVDHPQLVTELKKWRLKKADTENAPTSRILQHKALFEVARVLPNSIADLRKIAGVGEKTVQKRGLELIRLVDRYRKKQGLEKDKMPQTQLKIPGFEKKTVPETKRTSFEMFKSGLTIAEIAKKRGFTESTIEGHLCFFIEQGRLDVNRLLPLEKQALIREKLKVIGNGNDSLSVIKKQLGDDFSYGEIRMVLALQNYQTQ